MSCYGIDFESVVVWPYLDCGAPGMEKMMEGFDLVFDGTVAVSFGYNQANAALVTDAYELTGDTYSGIGLIPFPVASRSFQLRLTFPGDQQWEWYDANLYIAATPKT